jgi:hypothetical protein
MMAPNNGGILVRLQSTRPVATVAEFGTLDRLKA